VNSLPKTVTRQRHDCDLNLGPTAPELTTRPTKPPSLQCGLIINMVYSVELLIVVYCV